MDNEQEGKAAREALKSVIDSALQNALQSIKDYVSDSEEIRLELTQESKYSQDIYNVLVHNDDNLQPLSFLSLFEFDQEAAESVYHQMQVFLTACGFEVLEISGDAVIFSDKDAARIEKINDFVMTEQILSIKPEYIEKNDESCWSIRVFTDSKSVEILNLSKVSERSISILEKQLAIILASFEKTVEVSDSSRINMYGCVHSPLES